MITKFNEYGKDIVITLPSKIEWSDYEKELDMVEKEGGILNFKVSKFPKDAMIGSKCYVIHKGFIKGYMIISGFSEKNFKCEVTGEKWTGKFIERKGKFHYINPVPMKGFQGFRYIHLPLTESHITLKDFYEEYPDREEMIWNYIGTYDYENQEFEIVNINPLDYYEKTLKDQYEHATEDQIELVEYYRKMPNLKDTIVVVCGEDVVDGYHRLVALALEGITSVKAINLEYEYYK